MQGYFAASPIVIPENVIASATNICIDYVVLHWLAPVIFFDFRFASPPVDARRLVWAALDGMMADLSAGVRTGPRACPCAPGWVGLRGGRVEIVGLMLESRASRGIFPDSPECGRSRASAHGFVWWGCRRVGDSGFPVGFCSCVFASQVNAQGPQLEDLR